MSQIRLDIKGKRPSFFGDPAIDSLMTALLETMSENHALRERVYAMETVLVEKGVLSDGEVETAQLSEGFGQKIASEQQEFLHDAFRALNADFHSRAAHQAAVDKE